jgi:hypothetical protein
MQPFDPVVRLAIFVGTNEMDKTHKQTKERKNENVTSVELFRLDMHITLVAN